MNIETGKRVHGYNFTELAMPDYIIDRVHQLAEEDHAPELDADGCPIFEGKLGVPFDANNPFVPSDQLSGDDLSIDDESYHPDSNNDDLSPNDVDSISNPDSASFSFNATEARSGNEDDPPRNPPSDASSAPFFSFSSSSSTSRSPSNNDSAQSENTRRQSKERF